MTVYFSIIIPTHNRLAFLQTAVNSILSQTFKNYEIIIVNDASDDGTQQWLETLNHKNIRCIHNVLNKQKSLSRNIGIEAAQGEYICFLDDDDYYLPEHLFNLHNFIQTNNITTALIHTQYFNKKDDTLIKSDLPYKQEEESPSSYFLKIGMPSSALCIHKDILKEEKFNSAIKIAEDIELCLRIAPRFPIYHFNQYSTVIVKHDDNCTIKKDIEKDVLFALRKICFDQPYKNDIPKQQRHHTIAKVYYDVALSYSKNQYCLFVYYLFLALIYNRNVSGFKHTLALLVYKLPFIRKNNP